MSELSGRTLRQPFALFDPDMCSWRTSRQSLDLGNLPEPAGIWPKAGTWDLGAAYELPMSELLTAGQGSSFLLPTPSASRGDRRGQPSTATATATATARMDSGRRNLDD